MIQALKDDLLGTIRAFTESLWVLDALVRAALLLGAVALFAWGLIHAVLWLASVP